MNSTITKLLLLIAVLMPSSAVFAQFDDDDDDEFEEGWAREESKFYFSGGFEMIFSWADTEHPTSTDGAVLRWAPVLNMQGFANFDLTRNIGLMSGLAIRNVGYIYDFNNIDGENFNELKKKFRTYNLGIPLGLKLGRMDGFYVFGGYEFEFPFHYKEKTFDTDGSKILRQRSWFSDRVEKVQQSWFVGIHFKEGFTLKFKYYLTEFHNQDFRVSPGDLYPPSGVSEFPYAGLESNVMYISLSSIISKKNFEYYKPPKRW